MIKLKYKIINRKRFLAFILSILAFISFVIIFSLSVNAKSCDTISLVPIYVEQGDTLWSLSQKNNNTSLEIRYYIEKVVSLNNLNSSLLEPGQLLYMPIISSN